MLYNEVSFSKQEIDVLNLMIDKNIPDDKLLNKYGIKGLELKEFKKKMDIFSNLNNLENK